MFRKTLAVAFLVLATCAATAQMSDASLLSDTGVEPAQTFSVKCGAQSILRDQVEGAGAMGSTSSNACSALPKYQGATDYYFTFNSCDIQIFSNIQFDANGIPMVLENGVYQYNPVTIAQYGLREWGCYKASQSSTALAKVVNVANWLVKEQDSASGKFPYTFNLPYSGVGMGAGTLIAPWASSLAQGQSISLLLRAYNATSKSVYLTAAENATKPLTLTVANGGLVDDFQGHPVYEEYPTTPPSFVLNGFMFTLIGLYDLSTYYEPAQQLYDQGMQSLDFILPYYDLADTTTYNLARFTRTPSAAVYAGDYQPIHVEELQLLQTVMLPGDKIIPFYSNLWCKYPLNGLATLPALITPAPSTTLAGTSVNFTWNPGSGSTGFKFQLGTTGPGADDIYDGSSTTKTSVSISNIPTNGSTLFARLNYELNGNWLSIDYIYTEPGTLTEPTLNLPAPSSTVTSCSDSFLWNTGAGPTRF